MKNIEKEKEKFEFLNREDFSLLLASINGEDIPEDITVRLPFKDDYGTILQFKYDKDTDDVYIMMEFIKNDLQLFIKNNTEEQHRSLSKTQIDFLKNFMKAAKKENLKENNFWRNIWDMLESTFRLTRHERFNIQEVKLFNMCYEYIEKQMLVNM